jgi:hypothetical protein
MLTGGCYCGRVRYEAAGTPRDEGICHCSICRRTTGAPMVAWFSVDAPSFRFTQGEPRAFHSTPGATRRFCADCGTQLTFEAIPGEVDVATASLDDPEAATPRFEIWAESRLGWMDLVNRLPRHGRRRPED